MADPTPGVIDAANHGGLYEWPVNHQTFPKIQVIMIADLHGCPNASLEAMAMGLPVVASQVDGTQELIRDGINGYLVSPGDADGFAELSRPASAASRRRPPPRRDSALFLQAGPASIAADQTHHDHLAWSPA